MENETCVPIRTDYDILLAREKGRGLALDLGLSSTESILVATAISELARNILRYARAGEIRMGLVHNGDRQGIALEARDQGPGIPDVERALQAGYSTSGGLGLGLPGVRRLMDEFEIDSRVGRGTVVKVKKWRR